MPLTVCWANCTDAMLLAKSKGLFLIGNIELLITSASLVYFVLIINWSYSVKKQTLVWPKNLKVCNE